MWQERREEAKETFKTEDQRDRARIIHSSSFRRLQTKTQILGVGENDFYRTRLTHSLEVAQIGSGICEILRSKNSNDQKVLKWLPSVFQIETICLSHDIGHPPFGHGGEVALSFYMNEKGGFEGNGQTLRIVSKLGEYSKEHGLDLTRRSIFGLLKYPALHDSVANYQIPKNIKNTNIDAYKPPKCIHNDEKDVLDWLCKPLTSEDKKLFLSTKTVEEKHSKTSYKSFDTTIMEYADDIAYGVHDLEDALALQLISQKSWKEKVVDKLDSECEIKKDIEFYSENLFSHTNKERKHAIGKLVNYFIQNIHVIENKDFQSPILKYQAQMKIPAESSLSLLKGLVVSEVILLPEVQTLEYKGQQLIMRLFEVLNDNPKRLLPHSTLEKYQKSDKPERVICDYVSGMSDNYATKLYHKLFSPSIGSVFDKL